MRRPSQIDVTAVGPNWQVPEKSPTTYTSPAPFVATDCPLSLNGLPHVRTHRYSPDPGQTHQKAVVSSRRRMAVDTAERIEIDVVAIETSGINVPGLIGCQRVDLIVGSALDSVDPLEVACKGSNLDGTCLGHPPGSSELPGRPD